MLTLNIPLHQAIKPSSHQATKAEIKEATLHMARETLQSGSDSRSTDGDIDAGSRVLMVSKMSKRSSTMMGRQRFV